MLCYAVIFSPSSYFLVGALLLIGMISFWDDVQNLPNRVRLLVHLLSVTMLLYAFEAFHIWPVWLIPIGYFFIIGTINGYNFMDGINGMTGLYSLIGLCSLLFVNVYIEPFTDNAFIICPILASMVFLFFNFRKKAKCFAGDVGSVSMGFWMIALILMAIIETGSIKYILFLSVYGVDTALTVGHRLLLKQNIFEAHRLHFYQILANDKKVNHLVVASIYGGLQLGINWFLISVEMGIVPLVGLSTLPLVVVYVGLKPKLMKKEKKVYA
nr:UDP-GlcNAc--UDP-phosphate GlcNAc-1-phosphate transferase [Litoribacter ruber]